MSTSDENNEATKLPNTKKKRIARIISGIAPQLAQALGGPLAGAAVERISGALFGIENADEESINNALKGASPEQITALRRADLEFHRLLRETTIEQARIDAADRANAREHQQITKDRTPSIIGALIIFGFFVVFGRYGCPPPSDWRGDRIFNHAWRPGHHDRRSCQLFLWDLGRV